MARIQATGVTLDMVHRALGQKIAQSKILTADVVYLVLDDEDIPLTQPPSRYFVTVRLPSFAWHEGDVFGGEAEGLASISSLMCLGDTRITLWLKNQSDIWGRFDEGAKEAAGPEGGRLLGRLMVLLWEAELRNAAGECLLDRRLRFDSYDAPGPGFVDWKPFRLTYEIRFSWDLRAETLGV